MATTQNEIKVSVTAGPSEMQLMMSLMRPYRSLYQVDMDKGTSVRFTTHGGGFHTSINLMQREDGSGNRWILEGYVFDDPSFRNFRGFYDSKTRKGYLTLIVR